MKEAWRPPDEVLAWLPSKFAYDAISGTIMDRVTGKTVGGLSRKIGYKVVWLTNRELDLRKRVYFHRLAWFLHHGVWPDRMIDHEDRDRLNCRIANLRLADDTQNARNQSKIRTSNGKAPSSKLLGVCWDKRRGKWVSHIRVNGKLQYLGTFAEEALAAEAYRAAAAYHFGEFAPQDSEAGVSV